MINKITFLGTAGDSYIAGKQIRASGGIIVRLGEVQLHVDPGPGALARATEFGINLRANTAVLVSNNNLLQSNDANAVIDAMTYGGVDKKGVLVANSSFVEGTDSERPGLANKQKSFVERIVVMNKGQKLGIENVEIHALSAITDDPNAIGFKMLAPDFTLVYTSNTKYSRDLIKEYEGADILILNVPEPGEEKVEGRLNSEGAIKLIKGVNPKLAIITHFGIKMIKADPLYEGREIQKATGVQVLIAKDGFSISPGSYAAKSDQKRLNTFKNQETGEVTEREHQQPISESPSQEEVPEQEEVIVEESKEESEDKEEQKEKTSAEIKFNENHQEDKEEYKDHQEFLNF